MILQIDNIGDTISGGIEIGRSISEFGFMAIAAGFFIFIAILTMWFNYQVTKKLISNLVEKKAIDEKELSKSIDELTRYLEPMSNESLLRSIDTLKRIAANEFELSVEKVCNIVANVKKENHIHDNPDYVKTKLKRLLTNVHKERTNYFVSFRHNGHPLSHYVNPKWTDMVYEVASREVFDDVENPDRTRSNVKAVYAEIEIDFMSNMLNK